MAALAEFDFGNGSYPGSGTTVYDISGNGNHLTFPNGLTYTTVLGGEATLSPSQTSNLIGSYPNNLPQGSVSHTMVIWAKYTSTYNVAMFANGGASPAGARIDLGYGFGSRLGGEIYGLGFDTAIADTPSIGQWFQFVCVKPSNSNTETNADLVLYYNGSSTTTTPVTGTAAININTTGPIPSSGPGLAINWQGASGDMAIIKAAIYPGAWTPTDVANDYAAFVARITPAKFDLNASESASASGSGSTWYDLSGNNYNYTMTNPTFVAPTPSNPGYFQFPISNTVHPPVSYGTYTGTPAVTDTSWTIYAWVNYAGAGSTTNVARYPIFWNGIDPNISTDGWNFQLTGPGQAPAGRMQLEGKTISSTINSNIVPSDQWVQVAAKLNGSSGYFYINGVNVGSFSGFSFNTPTSAMFIEKTYNDSFPGGISIVRLYDTVLSDTDILNLYNYDLATYFTPSPPAYQGLVGGRTFGSGFAG